MNYNKCSLLNYFWVKLILEKWQVFDETDLKQKKKIIKIFESYL